MGHYLELRLGMLNQKTTAILRLLGACMMAGILSACAQHKTLYNWESYQPSVHAYLEDDGTDHLAQTEIMEENIEAARAQNEALPPGFHAHLGLLYLKDGQAEKATAQFNEEKVIFPESTSFMDFLLRDKTPAPAATTISQSSPETNRSAISRKSQSFQGS